MKISIKFLIRESFPLQLFIGVLTHSLPQRILGLKVDEKQHKVFNQREFSSAIVHGVLTHSLPQRIWGLKVDENQHKVFNQREFSLKFFMES